MVPECKDGARLTHQSQNAGKIDPIRGRMRSRLTASGPGWNKIDSQIDSSGQISKQGGG